ncbi:Metallo-dependent phosphatase-like protein [Thelonectria olida]|uniref:Metallo-dependent phosphatase-like protein n=1 Tax=Thelonectria olida TaxID=1576542 RepID=A0A9P8W877_9HYPO|nr:Metallo-dependent phosphatase-like protein [Thelonectria olida]
MMRILEAALIASLVGLSRQSALPRATDNDDLAPLKFNSNGTFQIAVFSDLHFGQYQSSTGPEQDRNSVRVIEDVLDYDRPDLVVLNGDLINGDTTVKENSTHYVDMIVTPIVERNLTWASTYGNHDHNYNLNPDYLLEREQSFTGCRTQKMVDTKKAGVTNYYLPVYAENCTSSTASGCTPEMILWFFDSRGGRYYQGDAQPNWVDASVVEWFNETNTALVDKYDKVIPSLVFVHIPVNASWALQVESGVKPHYQPGINDEEPVAQQGAGWCPDEDPEKTCTYSDQDVPFMEALVSIEGIIGVFSGHDHGNTWCYKWDSLVDGMDIAGNGINLCYNQHGGYGGYGDWIRGAREIVVSQSLLKEFAVDTHIRLETGDVVGSVSLNSTYNQDYYPSTPNTLTYMKEALEADSESAAPSTLRAEPWSLPLGAVACLGLWAFVILG